MITVYKLMGCYDAEFFLDGDPVWCVSQFETKEAAEAALSKVQDFQIEHNYFDSNFYIDEEIIDDSKEFNPSRYLFIS